MQWKLLRKQHLAQLALDSWEVANATILIAPMFFVLPSEQCILFLLYF